MLSEFDLIARYFSRPARQQAVALAGGDDCALLQTPPGQQLAISTDMLVSGRHFFADADPFMLGHKALAVNLSDLAAMGAQPLAFTLALALPQASAPWLASFSAGMLALADRWQCDLIGGDTTKGPLTISITVFGLLPSGAAIRRDGALPGDDIWVSGALGDARLALAGYQEELTLTLEQQVGAAIRMHQPQPRLDIGLALRGLASAAIDISDGLAGDLQHILQRSGVGAELHVDQLPCGPVLATFPTDLQHRFSLSGGDDYELCFTASATHRPAIASIAERTGVALTRIGQIVSEPGLTLLDEARQPMLLSLSGFDHFRES